MKRALLVLVVTACWWSCSPAVQPEEDAGIVLDSGVVLDAGSEPVDAGSDAEDAGVEPEDAGTEADAGLVTDAGETTDAGEDVDAGPSIPLSGFGSIMGDCGPLNDADLIAATPSTFSTSLDFAMMTFDGGGLSDGGAHMYETANLGGSSGDSEVFAFEVLHRCEFAELVATEAEVTYSSSTSKKTDMVVDIEGERIGVSVARAFKYPPGAALSVGEAFTLINRKFSDIHSSTMYVSPPYVWRKQILAVLAYDQVAVDAVIAAAQQVDAGTRGDTILYITRTDGNDGFIYGQ